MALPGCCWDGCAKARPGSRRVGLLTDMPIQGGLPRHGLLTARQPVGSKRRKCHDRKRLLCEDTGWVCENHPFGVTSLAPHNFSPLAGLPGERNHPGWPIAFASSRIIPRASPDCGSFEVRFADGRDLPSGQLWGVPSSLGPSPGPRRAPRPRCFEDHQQGFGRQASVRSV
jgi:hypothetical protein